MIIREQFRGPPRSGNGGYVAGLMSAEITGAVTVVLKAPIPIDEPLTLHNDQGAIQLLSNQGVLIGVAASAQGGAMESPPPPPTLNEASRAGSTFPGLTKTFHPVCFCCAPQLDEGYGLRVFVGQRQDEPDGCVAGVWTAHEALADADGLAPREVVWAALDCPGSVAWLTKQGEAGLLGTMTCEIIRRPAVGELCIITGWPIEQSGRKRISGTAMFTQEGVLLAQSRQIWIVW